MSSRNLDDFSRRTFMGSILTGAAATVAGQFSGLGSGGELSIRDAQSLKKDWKKQVNKRD